MVDKVRKLKIRDNNEITTIKEEKWFLLHFESLGADACIQVDFHDGVQYTYGSEQYCSEWAGDVEYVPGIDMRSPVVIPHTY